MDLVSTDRQGWELSPRCQARLLATYSGAQSSTSVIPCLVSVTRFVMEPPHERSTTNRYQRAIPAYRHSQRYALPMGIPAPNAVHKGGRSLRFGGKVEGRPPSIWCSLAGARLCAAKPFSNGFWFWSGRNGRSHRHGLSTSHLDEDGKRLQIDDGF